MAKFSLRRLLIQDFDSEYQGLMNKMAPLLNNALEQINSAFNNNLSVKDNMAGFETDLEVTAPVNSANPVFFKNSARNNIRMIICGQATTFNNGTPPTGTPFFTFESNGSEVKVTNITNLTDGTKYQLRIYCFS
jgi:hypothetical protein